MKRGLLILLFLVVISSLVYAHSGEVVEEKDLDERLKSNSITYLIIGSLIISLTVIFSIILKKQVGNYKKLLFILIVLPIVLVSVYLVYSTVYLNVVSETKGPVHWHADFEIWSCGEKINLVDPEGFSNRIGTSVFHEHGDDRIHLEGVVISESLVDLHNFFNVLNGELTNNKLRIPINEGVLEVNNGDLCNGKEGKLQGFVYKIKNPDDKKNWVYEQVKLENFKDYVLSPYSNVPPGDCIIIEFGEEKDFTDKLCETYEIAIQKGDLSGG